MKLEDLKGQKRLKANFSEKFSFWGKSPKSLKIGYFGFCQKFNPGVMYDSAKISCAGKVWFFSSGLNPLRQSNCSIL